MVVKRSRGRPQIGEGRNINLTLSDDIWLKIECLSGLEDAKMAERIRYIIEDWFRNQYPSPLKENV